MDEKLSPE